MAEFYRRRLPHLDAKERPIFITWRLHGSLPTNRVFPASDNAGKAFVAMDRILDRESTGPVHLRRPEIAGIVVDAFRYGEEHLRQYQLHAFVVMPNHVHLLLTPSLEFANITHTLKRYTAREANCLLGLTGQPFWQDESYDHLVRNEREFNNIARHIENNPVSAGLATAPEHYLWSSARPIENRPAG